MLKKSASLSCSFGLFGLSGLSRLFGCLVCLAIWLIQTSQIDQRNQMDQTDKACLGRAGHQIVGVPGHAEIRPLFCCPTYQPKPARWGMGPSARDVWNG